MFRPMILFPAILILASASASAVIIDHNSANGVAALPQSTMDAIGNQKWFFTHASVGGNMLSGMNSLHAASPTRYQLTVSGVTYNSSLLRANNPPTTTAAGTVYECNRGNPGWSNKYAIFDNSVDAGWRSLAVDIVMDKLCYIDQAANATTYLNSMSALEALYPATTFVYTTMPLTTGAGSDNILRNQYNEAVRNYCSDNNKLLFDIADIEAYDPSGTKASTFTSGGVTYQSLYDGYTTDGGHLIAAGQQQVALGWYATAAAIAAPEPGAIAMLFGGLLFLGGLAGRRLCRHKR